MVWTKDLFKIVVPWFETVNLKSEYVSACRRIDDFKKYFPDYDDCVDGYHPPREYFWNVFFTLDPAWVELKMKRFFQWNKSKHNGVEVGIWIRADIFDSLRNFNVGRSKYDFIIRFKRLSCKNAVWRIRIQEKEVRH